MQRLQFEVEQPAEEPRSGGATSAPPSAEPSSAGEAMQTEQPVAAGGAAAAGGTAASEGPSTSGAAAQQAQQAVVPYARRLLLKSLLRAIAIASYGVGSQAQRANEADAATLYACLKVRRDWLAEMGALWLACLWHGAVWWACMIVGAWRVVQHSTITSSQCMLTKRSEWTRPG